MATGLGNSWVGRAVPGLDNSGPGIVWGTRYQPCFGNEEKGTLVSSEPVINAMTVDVEDYFQVSALDRYIDRSSWDSIAPRVESNTNRILAICDSANIRATFFVLGWVAERHPNLIRTIVNSGHELASHGHSHVRVTEQTPAEFRNDVRRTKHLLEDLGGCQVRGYRAASYSINSSNLWALKELEDAGYEYSSSIYPIRHDLYGMPEAPRFPFYAAGVTNLLEVPISTIRVFGRNLPCGGGGYFRLIPYKVTRWAIRRVNDRETQPCVFYFHPWEIDADQPRQQDLDLKTRVRHYLNLSRTEERLKLLLQDFNWDRMDRVFLPEETEQQEACRRVVN